MTTGARTLIGRRTYGKGTVQTIMPLTDGQALKITTSRYFTPAGVSINGVGIDPDMLLEGPEQPPADLDSLDYAARARQQRPDAGGARSAGVTGTAGLEFAHRRGGNRGQRRHGALMDAGAL